MADSPERDQFLAIMAEEPAVEQDEKEEVAGQAGLEDAYAHDIPMQVRPDLYWLPHRCNR